MKKQALIASITFFLCTVFTCLFFSCERSKDIDPIDFSEKIIIPTTTQDTILFFTSVDNFSLPVFISFPPLSSNSLPAIVVLHGSGGNWEDDDQDNDGTADTVNEWELSNQNKQWKAIFDQEGIVSAFPGSYYRRGTVENEGDWKNPPLQFRISATFLRNYDAYNTLELLRKLVREDGTPIIITDKVALMGFSHGATAVQSSLFDTSVIPKGHQWSQSYSGTTYTAEIKPPAALPANGGFIAGVMYYPGSFHNSYYGNPCSGTSFFQTYTDFIIHLPSDDSLTPNSNCMVETVENNGGGEVTVYKYEGVDHGFDRKTNGSDGAASTLAQRRSMDFLKSKLGVG
jgi:dienelactone hydrolase